MEVTTVKIYRGTKSALDSLKGDKETYDELIGRLVLQVKNKAMKGELVEAYKRMGKAELNILEEWEPASAEAE